MSRLPSHDEQGRPIVAELGRAETPDETAARKAATSLRHRRNQTLRNLVLALAASLGIVLLLVLVVVRPDPDVQNPIDYRAAAVAAQSSVDEPLIVPDLPGDWQANRAELRQGGTDGVDAWRIGFVTPATAYLALDQGIDANTSWVSQVLDGARSTGELDLAGLTWTVYDRRDVDDPGNLAYALVAESGASTIVLSGTASDAEFATLAEASVASLEGSSP